MTEHKSSSSKPYYVYILRCRDDSLYTGITPDIRNRMAAHTGRIKGGARYTKSHPVTGIEAAWITENKISAARMECAIKKLTRQEKLMLISEPEKLCEKYVQELSCYKFEACSRKFLDEVFETLDKSFRM